VIFRAPCSRRASPTSEKRNAISSEVAWRVFKLSGRSTPGNLLAKRPTSRNQGGICLGCELQPVIERGPHSSDSKSLQATFRSFAGAISFARALAFPRTIPGYGPSAPESKSSIACWNSKVWPISSQNWSLYVRRPGNRRTRSIGLRVLFSRRHRQTPASRAIDGVAHLVFVRCNCPCVRRTDLRLRHRKRSKPQTGLFFVLNGRVRKLFRLRRGSVF